MTATSRERIDELRDRARVQEGLPPRYARPKSEKPPAHLEPPQKLSSEDQRAMRLAASPQSGPGWRVLWAESAFTPGFRFQYVVLEQVPPPWAGLDDVLVDKGYRSRADLAAPTVRGDANQEPRPRTVSRQTVDDEDDVAF